MTWNFAHYQKENIDMEFKFYSILAVFFKKYGNLKFLNMLVFAVFVL